MKTWSIRLVKILAGLVAAALVLHTILLVASGLALRNARNELRAAGRPMTPEDIIPKDVPASENAAPLYESAFALLKSESSNGQGLIHALGYAAREFLAEPDSEAKRETLEALLANNAVIRALALVQQASERPRCNFQLPYDHGAMLLAPHVNGMLIVGRALPAKALLEIRRGDASQAWQTLQTALRMANALHDEPLLMSAMVRFAQARYAIEALQRIAADAPPDGETSARIADLLLALEDVASPMARAVDGERIVSGEWILANWKPESAQEFGAEGSTCFPPAFLLGYRPMLQFNHAWYLRTMGEWAGRIECADWRELLPAAGHEYSFPWYVLTARIVMPGLAGSFSRAGNLQANARITRTGLALLRHKAALGAYPAALAEIDPQFLSEIPLDPFTGQPLVYRPEGDGFLLYSFGENLADDGGTEETPDNRKSKAIDIVWRMPR